MESIGWVHFVKIKMWLFSEFQSLLRIVFLTETFMCLWSSKNFDFLFEWKCKAFFFLKQWKKSFHQCLPLFEALPHQIYVLVAEAWNHNFMVISLCRQISSVKFQTAHVSFSAAKWMISLSFHSATRNNNSS